LSIDDWHAYAESLQIQGVDRPFVKTLFERTNNNAALMGEVLVGEASAV